MLCQTQSRDQNTKTQKTKALLSFFLLSRLRMKIEIASKARNRARNTLRALRTRTWAALRYLVPRAGAGTPYSVQEIRRRPQKPETKRQGFHLVCLSRAVSEHEQTFSPWGAASMAGESRRVEDTQSRLYVL